jgi:transcriptional regulator with XRE-family HTH domain
VLITAFVVMFLVIAQITDLLRARRSAVERGRRVREAAGLSQRDLADELGVSEATISRWESNVTRPRRADALRYRRLLDKIEAELARGH